MKSLLGVLGVVVVLGLQSCTSVPAMGADIAGGGLQGDGVVGFVGRDLFHVWPRGAVDDGKFPVRDRSQGGDVQVYSVRWSNRKGDAAAVG